MLLSRHCLAEFDEEIAERLEAPPTHAERALVLVDRNYRRISNAVRGDEPSYQTRSAFRKTSGSMVIPRPRPVGASSAPFLLTICGEYQDSEPLARPLYSCRHSRFGTLEMNYSRCASSAPLLVLCGAVPMPFSAVIRATVIVRSSPPL